LKQTIIFLTAFSTAFDGSKRLSMDVNGCKIRWNALSTGLSRRQQGFKSPWGRQIYYKNGRLEDGQLSVFYFE
jgi:hypothetical protein